MSTGTSNLWLDFDGKPLEFQDGDYVRIDVADYPEAAASLPFLEGYVRGYDLSRWDGQNGSGGAAAYELYRLGDNPLRWVRQEFLTPAPPPFGEGHGRGAHQDGTRCDLCGAN